MWSSRSTGEATVDLAQGESLKFAFYDKIAEDSRTLATDESSFTIYHLSERETRAGKTKMRSEKLEKFSSDMLKRMIY
jgi:hypothetical protein